MAGQGAQLLLAVAHSGCQGPAAPRRRASDRVLTCSAPPGSRLGDVEPRLDPVEVALGQPDPRHERRQQGPAPDHVVGQRSQPVAQGAVLRRMRSSGSASSTRSAARFGVAGGEGVPDGVGEHAVLGVPAGGGPVQAGEPVRVGGGELGAQRVGEQVVVAEPLPLVVERDHEQVRPLEGLQHLLAVAAAGERVAQRTGQLSQHRGVEQERPDVVGLAAQHLVDAGSRGRTGGCR